MKLYPGIDEQDHSQFKFANVNDIETTGLMIGRAEVLTSANIICDYTKPDLPVIGAKLFQFRPRFPKNWSKDAEKVHGITLEEAMAFPEAHIAALEQLEWMESMMGDGPAVFMCHAMKPFKAGESYFDYGHLRALYYDLGLDNKVEGGHFRWEKLMPHKHLQSSVTWARHLKDTGALQTENAKLGTLCTHFGIHLDHHNAISDTKACRQLFINFRRP